MNTAVSKQSAVPEVLLTVKNITLNCCGGFYGQLKSPGFVWSNDICWSCWKLHLGDFMSHCVRSKVGVLNCSPAGQTGMFSIIWNMIQGLIIKLFSRLFGCDSRRFAVNRATTSKDRMNWIEHHKNLLDAALSQKSLVMSIALGAQRARDCPWFLVADLRLLDCCAGFNWD